MATEVLDIKIRDDGTRVVTQRLKAMGTAGERAGSQVRRGNKQAEDSFHSLAESVNETSRSIFLVRRAITTIALASGIRGIYRLNEQYIQLNNQLRTISSSEEHLASQRQQLVQISKEAYVSLADITQLYTRTTRAVSKLGYSEQQLLTFTKALSQEVSISGAATEEASNAIRQLTQGMGGAGLKGEELRSVLEQLPTVAERIAASLGVTQGELKQLGAEGKLTGQTVVDAMLEAADAIERDFQKAVVSPSKAFVSLHNSLLEFVGGIGQVTRASDLLTAAILAVANNLELVLSLFALMAGVAAINFVISQFAALRTFIVASLIPAVTSYIATLRAAQTAYVATDFFAATAALSSGAAVAAPAGALAIAAPYVAVAAAVGLIGYGVYKWVTDTDSLSDKSAKVRDIIKETREELPRVNTEFKIILQTQDRLIKSAEKYGNVLKAIREEGEKRDREIQQQGGQASNGQLYAPNAAALQPGNTVIDLYANAHEQAYLRLAQTLDGTKELLRDFGSALRNDRIALQAESIQRALLATFPEGGIGRVAKVLKEFQKNFHDANTAGNKELADFFVEEAAKKIRELAEAYAQLKLSDEEVLGSSAFQQAEKVKLLRDRLEELQKAYRDLVGPTEDVGKALDYTSEELDKLTGGVKAEIQQTLDILDNFVAAGGDESLARALAAGASPSDVNLLRALREELQLLKDAEKAATQEKEDAARAEEKRQDAIRNTIEALEQQRRAIGLNAQQLALQKFLDLGPNQGQLDQFLQKQKQVAEETTQFNAQQSLNQLVADVQRFEQAAERLREATRNAGPEVQAEVQAELQKVSDELQLRAASLAEQLAKGVGDSAQPIIDDAAAKMTAAGTDIGAATGDALGSAFAAALQRAIAGLSVGANGALPVGTGTVLAPGTVTPETQVTPNSILPAPQQFDQALSGLDTMIGRVEDLARGYEVLGNRAQTSFDQMGSAGQQAGNTINNIFTNAFSSLEDALVQFVTTGKLDFKQLINAMLADLARLVIRMLIIQPLMGFFGGFFGGFGFSGGGFLGDLVTPSFGTALPGFANGGLVDDPFANVPRFAGGGRVSGPGTGVSDSVPALLSRREFVVNAAATSRNLPALRTLNRTGELPSGGAVVNFAPNTVINVSGGQDGAKQGRNAAREFNAMIEAKFNELIRKEKRSGGALSRTTQDLI